MELGDRFNTLALPVTFAAWIYRPAAAAGDFRAILITDDHVGRYFGLWFQIGPAGDLQMNYGSGGLPAPQSRRSIQSVDAIPTDQWVHVVGIVRGPVDMTLYVNGSRVAGVLSGTTTSPLVHSVAPARIGMITTNPENRPWLGMLDDVRIYNCSLNDAGAAALHSRD